MPRGRAPARRLHGWTDGLIRDAIAVSTDRVDEATVEVAFFVGQCSLLVLAANSALAPWYCGRGGGKQYSYLRLRTVGSSMAAW